MRDLGQGRPFHGEFVSADASALTETSSRLTLYPAGSVSALTLGSTERIVVTDLSVYTAGSVVLSVYDGADATVDVGEVIHQATYVGSSLNGPVIIPFVVPHYCRVGSYPKVKTSGSGNTYVQIRGVILPNQT